MREIVEADFVDDLGDRWVEYRVYHHNVREYLNLMETKEIPDLFVESDSIDWDTVELPFKAQFRSLLITASAPPSIYQRVQNLRVVGELYRHGWKQGLKGITVYVDGSRTGVLINRERRGSIFPAAPRGKTSSGAGL